MIVLNVNFKGFTYIKVNNFIKIDNNKILSINIEDKFNYFLWIINKKYSFMFHVEHRLFSTVVIFYVSRETWDKYYL